MLLKIFEGPDYSGKDYLIQQAIRNNPTKRFDVIKAPFSDDTQTVKIFTNDEENILKKQLKEDRSIENQYRIMTYIHKCIKEFLIDLSHNVEDDYIVYQNRCSISTFIYQMDIAKTDITMPLTCVKEMIPHHAFVTPELNLILPSYEVIRKRQRERIKPEDDTTFFEEKLEMYYNRYAEQKDFIVHNFPGKVNIIQNEGDENGKF